MRFENRDCFDFMPTVAGESVDLSICDIPYGMTQCKWDSQLPLARLWEELWRVSKPESSVLMFAGQPFTSILVCSQIDNFKYEWIWEKSKASNYLDAKKRPLRAHESVLVFCRQQPRYFPQMSSGDPYKARPGKKRSDVYNKVADPDFRNENEGIRYPRSVVYFKTAESEGQVFHSTQKPLALIEYLIVTYSRESNIVLDPCAGSGVVGAACKRLKRDFLGCEIDNNIYLKAAERIAMQKIDDIFL